MYKQHLCIVKNKLIKKLKVNNCLLNFIFNLLHSQFTPIYTKWNPKEERGVLSSELFSLFRKSIHGIKWVRGLCLPCPSFSYGILNILYKKHIIFRDIPGQIREKDTTVKVRDFSINTSLYISYAILLFQLINP